MNTKYFIKKILPSCFYGLFVRFLGSARQLYNGFPYRQYTRKYECVFIHIPKTAGTSVLTCLMEEQIFRDHANYLDYKRIDPLKFEKYFKFCFVRNPYDRAVSFFEYLKRGGNQSDDLYFQELIKNVFPTFEGFVLEYLDKDRIHEHVLFRPQYLFIYDYKEECQVDYIGHYEYLKEDFEFVCDEIGASFELPLKNKVQRNPYENYYSNTLVKERIYNLYSKDFDLLKYPKEIK